MATPVEDTEWGRAVLPSYAAAALPNDDDDGDIDDEIDVAIIGGGLAGLAVAIGLCRANINCRVYERASQLRSTSQGILSIQPNGMKALEQIHPDLPEKIAQVGCERHTLVYTTIRADGSTEETVRDTGKEFVEKYGRPKVGLTWHKMQQVLAKMLPTEEVIMTSRSLVSFFENDNDIILTFEDIHTTSPGKPIQHRVRAKVALACDGVFSVARSQLFASSSEEKKEDDDCPLYFGQLNWATVIDTDKLPPNVHPPNAVHYFMNEGGETRWMSMINDGGCGQTFWQFRVVDYDKALSLSCNKGRGGLGLKGVKEALVPVAQQTSPLVSAVIEAIPENQIFERSIVGRLPAPTWLSPKKRLCLVGDSAHGMHPNIAQGANNSFESAAAIVQALVEEVEQCRRRQQLEKTTWQNALQVYEQRRKPKADIVQRFANMMGCYQASGETVLPKEAIHKMIEWIIDEDPEKYPSQDTLDTISAFDPCSQSAVSKIQ